MARVAVGLALRPQHLKALAALPRGEGPELVEVMVDDTVAWGVPEGWRAVMARWPVVAHGVDLAIGDAAGVSQRYLDAVSARLGALSAWWYSEHLCFRSRGDGAARLWHFAPLPCDPETLAVVAQNAARVRAAVGRPLLLENPSDVLGWGADGPDAAAALGLSFTQFLAAAEAGALLDLTNLVLDARNGGWSVGPWLDALDWSRVVEIHLAGGHFDGVLWVDSHSRAIDPEALDLLSEVLPRAPNLRAVIVERDSEIPPLAAMLDALEAVRGRLR